MIKPSKALPPADDTLPIFPMRINKYLALKQYSTRRGGDTLVEAGKVFINGRRATLGDKVKESDKVEVKGAARTEEYVYFAYHKPRGVITHSPQHGEVDIAGSLSKRSKPNPKEDIFAGVFPLGRLDKDSHGLIILTNDGRITDPLLNPEYSHTKEYTVTVKEKLRSSFKAKMEAGVRIGDYVTKPCKVKLINDYIFSIILTEGKKHQIRRMCDALFQEVDDLKRVGVMNIKLGKLAPNSYRKIEGEELKTFLSALGF